MPLQNVEVLVRIRMYSAPKGSECIQGLSEISVHSGDIKNTPTVNEKMTKQEIIKSLVEEIDKLQKDLDADRSGTGFYLDKDNNQKMLDVMMALTGETITAEELTKRKVERIKQLEDRMYSKVREFEETVAQCEEDLQIAKATKKERDIFLEQERFVSKWYENQTSEKLAEAKNLLVVTKNLHNENEILLAQLEHQFDINVFNQQKEVGSVLKMLDQFGNEETQKYQCGEEKIKNEIEDKILDFKNNFKKSSDTTKNISIEFEFKAKEAKSVFCVRKSILTKSKKNL